MLGFLLVLLLKYVLVVVPLNLTDYKLFCGLVEVDAHQVVVKIFQRDLDVDTGVHGALKGASELSKVVDEVVHVVAVDFKAHEEIPVLHDYIDNGLVVAVTTHYHRFTSVLFYGSKELEDCLDGLNVLVGIPAPSDLKLTIAVYLDILGLIVLVVRVADDDDHRDTV